MTDAELIWWYIGKAQADLWFPNCESACRPFIPVDFVQGCISDRLSMYPEIMKVGCFPSVSRRILSIVFPRIPTQHGPSVSIVRQQLEGTLEHLFVWDVFMFETITKYT